MRTALLLAVISAGFAWTQTEVTNAHKRDELIGQQLERRLLQRFAEVADGPAVAHLQQVGSKLARAAGVQAETRFRLVDGTSNGLQEPWVLPGGIIVVPLRMYLEAQRSEEFAGILAHAIAHHAEGHIHLRNRGDRMTLLYTAGDSMVPGAMVERVRSLELAADARAAAILTQAGYNPGWLSRYFSHAYKGTQMPPLSPLPPLEQRLQALGGRIAGVADVTDEESFTAAKTHAEEVTGAARRRRNPPSLLSDKR